MRNVAVVKKKNERPEWPLAVTMQNQHFRRIMEFSPPTTRSGYDTLTWCPFWCPRRMRAPLRLTARRKPGSSIVSRRELARRPAELNGFGQSSLDDVGLTALSRQLG